MFHKDIKSLNFLVGDFRVPLWTPHDVQIWLTTVRLPAFKAAFLAQRVRGEGTSRSYPGLLNFVITTYPELQCDVRSSFLL